MKTFFGPLQLLVKKIEIAQGLSLFKSGPESEHAAVFFLKPTVQTTNVTNAAAEIWKKQKIFEKNTQQGLGHLKSQVCKSSIASIHITKLKSVTTLLHQRLYF